MVLSLGCIMQSAGAQDALEVEREQLDKLTQFKKKRKRGRDAFLKILKLLGKLLLFSCSVMSDSLQPHEVQHARLPYPSPSPRVCLNSCPLSWRCHPTTSSSVIPFSCLQSFPASESFPIGRLFASGGQSIGASASASVLPMNI